MFQLTSGPYQGRRVALIQTAGGEIKLTWADLPYVSWSTPQTITTAADQAFDAVMEDSGTLHLVYVAASTNYLDTRQIEFSGGIWTEGAAVTIYNVDDSYHPSLARTSEGELWVSWTSLDAGTYTVRVKTSTDDGASWGTGPTDAGVVLASSANDHFSRLTVATSDIWAIFCENGTALSARSQVIGSGSWDAATILASGGDLDDQFDVAVSDSDQIGVVFDQAQLKFREFDGDNWGSVVTLDGDEGFSPQLRYRQNVPVVVYLSAVAGGQVVLKQTDRRTGSFSTPSPLDPRAGTFDSVLLYDLSSFDYADLTTAAASAATADVYHPESNELFGDPGDCLCVGMATKFRYLKLLLSTAGSGGSVVYSYRTNDGWIAFTPAGGNYAFDATDQELALWDDYDSIPTLWRKLAMPGAEPLYWVLIQVESDYTVGPVGSQITSMSDLKTISLRR
jgi:hypothetical protein